MQECIGAWFVVCGPIWSLWRATVGHFCGAAHSATQKDAERSAARGRTRCSVPVGAHSQLLLNAHENALVLGLGYVVLFGVCGGQQLVIFVARLIQRLRKMGKEVEPGAGRGALFHLVRTHSFS
jgi:hypothetical protein